MGGSLALWSWTERRSAAFHAEAARHDAWARNLSLACRIDSRRLWHHQELAAKYKRAASHPWLPLASDPPEPEWLP